MKQSKPRTETKGDSSDEEAWLTTKREAPSLLPCSHSVKKPFSPPQRLKKEENVDMEGWRALYEKPFHKEIEVKPRNRFHNDMVEMAEEERDKEKPQLPLENVQNDLVFKRMATRRQLLGSLI